MRATNLVKSCSKSEEETKPMWLNSFLQWEARCTPFILYLLVDDDDNPRCSKKRHFNTSTIAIHSILHQIAPDLKPGEEEFGKAARNNQRKHICEKIQEERSIHGDQKKKACGFRQSQNRTRTQGNKGSVSRSLSSSRLSLSSLVCRAHLTQS